MKKYIILTSLLTLTACGSNLNGGGVGAPVRVTTSIPYMMATPETIASNAQITPMNPEIDICHNCTAPRPDSDRVAIRNINGTNFTIYDLTDVSFIRADTGFDGNIKFNVDPDTKRIIGIVMDDESLVRQNNNTFAGLVNTDNGESIDGTLKYTSFAKSKNMGLRYSDFGKVQVFTGDNETPYKTYVFVGGYSDTPRQIQNEDIDSEQELTFNGYATGTVTAVRDGLGHVLNLDTSNNANDDDKVAVLNFNNGTTTLTAKFDNWYDVQHVKSDDQEHVIFSNYVDTTTDINGNSVDDNTFRMISDTLDTSFTLDNHEYNEYDNGAPTETIVNSLNSDIRFYGNNGNPSESVGIVQIRDTSNYNVDMNNYETHDEVRMNLGFGGKK